METKNDIEAVYAENRHEWRKWLEKNASTGKAVWLIIYHKKSQVPSINYPESVEEALCFGWIDSKSIKRDGESSYQMYTPRKSASKWSSSNKERVERMSALGLMTPAGQAFIDLAKKTGTWDALVDAENAVISDDLRELFAKSENAFKNFEAFPPSTKRQIIEWVSSAKRPETRQQRIEQTVEMAEKNIRVKG